MKPLKIVLCDFTTSLDHDRPLWDVAEQPLGLMFLSAWLKRAFGKRVSIRILVSRLDFGSMEEFGVLVAGLQPDLVGLRSLTFHSRQLHLSAEEVRRRTTARIVAGGPYPSSAPERVASDENIDAVVIGEAERTMEEIVGLLLDGDTDWREVQGLCLRDGGETVRTGDRELIYDLSELPMPDYDAVQPERYAGQAGFSCSSRARALVQFSRGCPYSCVYCHDIMKKSFRTRPVDTVFQEIAWLRNDRGINDFVFVDDLFNLHKKKAEELLVRLRDELPGIRLFFPNGLRGDLVDAELLDLLVSAGMVEVNYALETASPRLQAEIGKNLNVDRLVDTVNATTEKEVVVGLFMMMGFPGETEEEAESTYEALARMPFVHFPYLNMLKIYEGTELYRKMAGEGIDREAVDRSINESYDRVRPELLPFSERFVQKLKMKILQRHFFRKSRLAHVLPIQRKLFQEEELERKYRMYLPHFKGMESLNLRTYSMYSALAGESLKAVCR